MTTGFAAIVKLIRKAHRKALSGHQLTLVIPASNELDALLDDLAEFRDPELFVDGNQHFGKVSGLPVGKEVEVRIARLTSNTRAIALNLSALLAFQAGVFFKEPPPEYYLVEEDYASAEAAPRGSLIERYQRMPRIVSFLKRTADVVLADGAALVFLVDKRLDMDIRFTVADLNYAPECPDIDLLEAEIFSAPFAPTKARLLKSVLRRFLEAVDPSARLGQLLRTWKAVVDAFHADFGLYESEFNFEKVREAFEKKKLDYVLKLNSATSDSLTKLLAIPVAQGLLVSQMKADSGAMLANWALVIGSIVFAVIASLILLNHRHSIMQISEEIALDRSDMENKFPVQYLRVKSMYNTLSARARLSAWYPWALGGVLAVATLLTIYAFLHVPPFGPAIVGTETSGIR
jgi:hypothetical protein